MPSETVLFLVEPLIRREGGRLESHPDRKPIDVEGEIAVVGDDLTVVAKGPSGARLVDALHRVDYVRITHGHEREEYVVRDRSSHELAAGTGHFRFAPVDARS
jgi:hypothetical protein